MLLSLRQKLDGMKIVLGSSSPRRRELCSSLFNFTVVASNFDESTLLPEEYPTVAEFVKVQAKCKAEEILTRVSDVDMLITADTMVAMDNHILGKPHTHEKAKEMITMLSGKSHSVISGVFIAFPKLGKTFSFHEETLVYFDEIPQDVIDVYASTDDPLDKAGGYGIQSIASSLISKIDGDYYNVMGLPLNAMTKTIAQVLREE